MSSGVSVVRGPVTCGECRRETEPSALVSKGGAVCCPHCGARVCRICGCTDHNACPEGYAWSSADPEVCDAHEGEV